MFADQKFIEGLDAGTQKFYNSDYWMSEIRSSMERSYGSSISRVAETFLYSRGEISNFLDIGSGPGYLLDALGLMLPEMNDVFHGIEFFPPPTEYRSGNKNYHIGSIGSLKKKFQARGYELK